MIGDRTRIAEYQVFAAIALLGAATYMLTLAAKSSAQGRDRYRARHRELTLECIDLHDRVRAGHEVDRVFIAPPAQEEQEADRG